LRRRCCLSSRNSSCYSTVVTL